MAEKDLKNHLNVWLSTQMGIKTSPGFYFHNTDAKTSFHTSQLNQSPRWGPGVDTVDTFPR